MNSYNDNLHNSVVASLNEQEISLQTISSKYNAAEDTLYYRQSNRITTHEDLQLATTVQKFYQEARDKTVECSNSSINLQGATDQAKDYLDKTVSNTAVAAANVQIASNAVLKLASDVGSIFSIVNAADFESEIYYLSQRTKERMDETAFDAEAVSQVSMEATSSISNVPIEDLKKRSDQINESITLLQTTVTSEYDKANNKVKADSAKLELATNAEKKAEGELYVRQKEYNSTRIAYNITNKELNLDLDVLGITEGVNVAEQTGEVVVNFNDYESPFPDPSSTIQTNQDSYGPSNYFPISSYYVFVTKYKKKSTFSISNAEEILNQYPLETNGTQNEDVRYAVIERADIKHPQKEGVTITSIGENLTLLLEKYIEGGFDPTKDNPNYYQLDSDGDPIVLGEQYVVFIMGEFEPRYKKNINNFDDYLSGASENFALEVNIPGAQWPLLDLNGGGDHRNESSGSTDDDNHGLNPEKGVGSNIYFQADNTIVLQELKELLSEEAYNEYIESGEQPVDYRCMFLPVVSKNVDDPTIVMSMLTASSLRKMDVGTQETNTNQKVTSSSSISDELSRLADIDQYIISQDEILKAELEENKKALEDSIESKRGVIIPQSAEVDKLERQIGNANSSLKKAEEKGDKDSIKKYKDKVEQLQGKLDDVREKVGSLSSDVDNHEEEIANINEAIANLEAEIEAKKSYESMLKNEDDLGFLFDETIACKIPYSCYSLGQLVKNEGENNTSESGDSSDGLKPYYVELKPETTDNFGNRLVEDDYYLPVVLSIFDQGDSNKNKFGMKLSLGNSTFCYKSNSN